MVFLQDHVPARIVKFFCFYALSLIATTSLSQATAETQTLFKQSISPYATLYAVDGEIGPLKFGVIVDTGATYSAIDPSLNMSVGLDAQVVSMETTFSDGSKRMIPSLEIPGLKIQSLQLSDLRISVLDLSTMRKFHDPRIKALLGIAAFGDAKFLVNNDESTMELYEGPSKFPAEDSSTLSLSLGAKTPVFSAAIEGRKLSVLVDTGAEGGLSLPAEDFEEFVKSGVIELSAQTARSGSLSPGATFKPVRRGWFTRGELMEKSLIGMDVVETTYPRVIAGVSWLHAFNFEVDFSNFEFRYQLRRNPNPPPAVDLMLGAKFTFEEGGMRIERLRPDGNGSAEKAGLKPGDLVTSFGSHKIIDSVSLTAAVVANAGKSVKFAYMRPPDKSVAECEIEITPFLSDWDSPGRDIFGVLKK